MAMMKDDLSVWAKFFLGLIHRCKSNPVMESEAFRYMKKCEVLEACYQQERRRNYIYLGFVSWIIYYSTVRLRRNREDPWLKPRDLGGWRKYVQQALGDASMDFELPKEGIFRLLFSSSNVNVAG
ncbi:hypothetical protein SO802_013994 [Lithocarpus litseifolius]|uniref:Uncharacterized protein n=1 Tax=Lithocarpus litseifolius TaxID=425828 RepID=A0AAW2D9P9_9ROSI